MSKRFPSSSSFFSGAAVLFPPFFLCRRNNNELSKTTRSTGLPSIPVRLPLTISIHRAELDSIFLPEPDDLFLPFNFTHLDWYLISSGDTRMALVSPPVTSSLNTSSSSTHAMALAHALPVALVLSSIVVLCICGNILVILSVFTFRPLRTVQNFFIVSLACSDMLVAIMVMPFHIVTHIVKRWIFGKSNPTLPARLATGVVRLGKVFCQIFALSDVLLCTSSILNLCAIAVGRSIDRSEETCDGLCSSWIATGPSVIRFSTRANARYDASSLRL